MIINVRCKHSFIELSVDVVTETIWKESKDEIDKTILNLFDVIADLANMNDMSLDDYLERYKEGLL